VVEVATRPTPPEPNIKSPHPEGMPKTHGAHFWHPSGMRFLSAIISGGVTRQVSLNHRLSSGKPPACFDGNALPKIGCCVTSVTMDMLWYNKKYTQPFVVKQDVEEIYYITISI
jgi:hypothetical protein